MVGITKNSTSTSTQMTILLFKNDEKKKRNPALDKPGDDCKSDRLANILTVSL